MTLDVALILQGVFWCIVGISTLLIGAWIAFRIRPSSQIVGLIMGFGAGALLSAVAYELFPETSRDLLSFIALSIGAIVLYIGTSLTERRSHATGTEKGTRETTALAQMGQTILLGSLLEGIPECLVLGMSLAIGGTVNVAFLGAMLIATLPLGISASSVMARGGMSRRTIYTLWLEVLLVCVIFTVGGVVLIEVAPYLTGIYAMAAAGGAVLAMLSITMIPEGFQEGGKLTALMVVLGFAFASILGVIS